MLYSYEIDLSEGSIMVYQVGICDDSEADRNYIQDLARQWAAQRGHTLNMRSFASGEEFLFHYA